MSEAGVQDHLCDVAIVGMAGRFPGAANVDELWRNLLDGVESITFFSDEEAAVSDPAVLRDPSYVKAWGILQDVDLFDAAFFGIPPDDATLMDPQHRVFLECAWEALERAGYVPHEYPGRIGVFAGASASTYERLIDAPATPISMAGLPAMLGNQADFLPARVSFKLGLRGPSVNVQTACCTSLTAVHTAYQSLLNRECDMALAGGVSILLPQTGGYLYQEGGFLPPDGHCRAFDARAQGAVGGNGACLVVLKRLDEALEDGDRVHAVIRGSALNNDGSRKLAFVTPGVDGQAEAVAEALAAADVDARTIGYVEAHGVATLMGDPTEVAALTRAFRAHTQEKQFCALGSVKTNVGHLGAAASVTSLVKAALALEHRKVPASLHFERPPPHVDLAGSPFYVNTRLRDWPPAAAPARAIVHAFGLGGTNVSMVLEEAPAVRPAPARPWQLLVLSAKTGRALDAAAVGLARHLRRRPDLSLADAAFTLQVGRQAFEHRRSWVCRGAEEAAEALEAAGAPTAAARASDPHGAVFLFPDVEAPPGTPGRDLYETEATFRAEVDRCSELLRPHLGLELRHLLFPQGAGDWAAPWRTGMSRPALFVVEYALARLWMEWGVEPRAMIGVGVGEYVAACLADVLSLEDALLLAAARGRGAPAPAEATSGSFELEAALRKVPTVEVQLGRTSLRAPGRRFWSSVGGDWITPAQATDPAHWIAQGGRAEPLTRRALGAVSDPGLSLLAVGPSAAGEVDLGRVILPSLRRGADPGGSDVQTVLGTLGRLWCAGVRPDWRRFHAHARRRRVPLPTYPFERQRYWAS